eukprot:gene7895-10715_t
MLEKSVKDIFPEIKCYDKDGNLVYNNDGMVINRPFILQYDDDELNSSTLTKLDPNHLELVTFSSDEELLEAIRVLEQINQLHKKPSNVLKFYLKILDISDKNYIISNDADINMTCAVNSSKPVAKTENDQVSTPLENTAVHDGVKCDACGMNPILGIRYKCTVRVNYDLCSSCESISKQPHPIIKIFDPISKEVQAEFDEQTVNRANSFPYPRCKQQLSKKSNFVAPAVPQMFPPRPHPHHHHPPRHFGLHGIGGRHGNINRIFNGPNENENKCSWRERSSRECANNSFNDQPDPKSSNVTFDGIEEEDQLVEQAIRESLIETQHINLNNNIEQPHAVPTLAIHVKSSSSQNQAKQQVTESFELTRTLSLAKPALRFVRDISYPDGTNIFPNVNFVKKWLVRNDGNIDWPQGTMLVNAGGDLLTINSNMKFIVPLLLAGKEGEIIVEMTSPSTPGRYISYFRMQTKEEKLFGQRLWADILVIQPHDSQEVINQPPFVTADLNNNLNDDHNHELSVINGDVKQNDDLNKWSRELFLLSEMGFHDAGVIIPLLENHIPTPCPNNNQNNRNNGNNNNNNNNNTIISPYNNTDGLQRVIVALLQQSKS